MHDAYLITVLDKVELVPEVCNIHLANAFRIVIAETHQRRGMLGVVDSYSSKGIEMNITLKNGKVY